MFSEKANINNQLNSRQNTIKKLTPTTESSQLMHLNNQCQRNVQEMKLVLFSLLIFEKCFEYAFGCSLHFFLLYRTQGPW